MKRVTAIIVMMTVLFGYAEKQPFERYQPIIDRYPFGAPPPGFDPSADPATVEKSKKQTAEDRQLEQEQQKLMKAVSFSVINIENGVVYVGFTDNSDPKKPLHYYLPVGEERNGWKVKEADPAKATMVVVKDEIEVALELGSSSKGGAANTATAAGGKSTSPNLRSVGAESGSPRSPLLGAGGGIRSRRKLRQEEQAAAAAERSRREAEQAEKEAADKAEREARAAEESAQLEIDREQKRALLQQIQEELRQAREARKKADEEAENNTGEGDASE